MICVLQNITLSTTTTILMVRPAAFGYNEETAANNYFQSNPGISQKQLQEKALEEFDNMVDTLRGNGITVLVIEDTKMPPKPDALFPNNWLSTSPDGLIAVFPMYAPNRRNEKRDDILQQLAKEFVVRDVQDWSEYEAEGRFLEGTGSMVIDHGNKMIYAAISERTNLSVLEKFAVTNNYQAIVFLATDKQGRPVYHTNVVMTLGEKFCVLCEEAIDEEWELIAVRQLLESTQHTIIPITREQMHCFAGNMLEVKNSSGENLLVMSKTAFDCLRREQKEMLEAYARLLPIAVPVIEQVEGGSVRCMMAEVFLQKK
ncbi:MAG TPA: arginine deiminase-related protein [Chitinophagaceae bacterium]|nr:arginine deiminase-related protein [Chitinophagaceae bacterium]